MGIRSVYKEEHDVVTAEDTISKFRLNTSFTKVGNKRKPVPDKTRKSTKSLYSKFCLMRVAKVQVYNAESPV